MPTASSQLLQIYSINFYDFYKYIVRCTNRKFWSINRLIIWILAGQVITFKVIKNL